MKAQAKRYNYPTGNIELMIRHQAGEPLPAVLEDVKEKWRPGNEHLWDEYDAESLVDSDEKRQYDVNQLLYARVRVYRALKAKGVDVRGRDPFRFLDAVPDLVSQLRDRFPHVLGGLDGKGHA